MRNIHARFRNSKRKNKLRLRIFMRDFVELFWRWLFYLNLAILTKLTWSIFGLSKDDESAPVLAVLLLTTSILTLTVKAVDSNFKIEEEHDKSRTPVDSNHYLRSFRNRFRIVSHLAPKASRLTRSSGKNSKS